MSIGQPGGFTSQCCVSVGMECAWAMGVNAMVSAASSAAVGAVRISNSMRESAGVTAS